MLHSGLIIFRQTGYAERYLCQEDVRMKNDYQYWVVGANWSGEDQARAFYRRGYWELGWSDEQQPQMASLRDQMKAGDRIAIKSMRGQGSSTITIKGLGIIKELDENGRVYVNWIIKDLNREVPAHGCFASIHGPYSPDDESGWLGEVFRI